MAVETSTNNNSVPFIRFANPGAVDLEGVIVQDAGRSADLAPYTVMAQDPTTEKYTPLSDVDVAATTGKLVCGALGTNLAGFQAVTDGEFSVTVNGVAIDITGLDFSGIAALGEIKDVINVAADGKFLVVSALGGPLTILSNIAGDDSSVSVLGTVSGGSGTDISGSGFLNGAAGTATAGAGPDGTDLPAGIYIGDTITAADIVAGDISDAQILTGAAFVDENQLVLENSLALSDEVKSKNMTIKNVLAGLGIFVEDTVDISGYENA